MPLSEGSCGRDVHDADSRRSTGEIACGAAGSTRIVWAGSRRRPVRRRPGPGGCWPVRHGRTAQCSVCQGTVVEEGPCMKCPACENDVPAGRSACTGCGAPLPAAGERPGPEPGSLFRPLKDSPPQAGAAASKPQTEPLPVTDWDAPGDPSRTPAPGAFDPPERPKAADPFAGPAPYGTPDPYAAADPFGPDPNAAPPAGPGRGAGPGPGAGPGM